MAMSMKLRNKRIIYSYIPFTGLLFFESGCVGQCVGVNEPTLVSTLIYLSFSLIRSFAGGWVGPHFAIFRILWHGEYASVHIV